MILKRISWKLDNNYDHEKEYKKISKVGAKTAMAICGEVGDTEYFRDMIKMDMELYRMKEFISIIKWFLIVKFLASAVRNSRENWKK